MSEIAGFVRDRGSHHVVTLDASMCVMASEDAELRAIVQSAELITPDSAGILWACRRSGTPLAGRVSGVDMVAEICSNSALLGWRVYLLGAAPGVAEAAAEELRRRSPGCAIVGTHHGYFGASEVAVVEQAVADASPDVLLVALGIPRQEKWIADTGRRLGVPVMIGVGGSFDVYAGVVKRAPVWVQRLNLEWLHRLASNPRKIGKVMTLPVFVWRTLTQPRDARH